MNNQAYIAGVLHGDGYLTEKAIGILAADKDFVQAFADALNAIYNVKPSISLNNGYWRCVKSNITGKFSSAKTFEPVSLIEKSMWLRGLFDSEGNAQLAIDVGARKYTHRRISMYSTEISTLERAQSFLLDLEIETRLRATKNSVGHKGSKVVFEIAVRNKEGMRLFGDRVGSSIERKKIALRDIADSFVKTDYHRAAQLVGARVKRHRTMTVTLPKVLLEIRTMIESGEKPTQRACQRIEGYSTIQKIVPQAELIQMAGAL